MKIDPIPTNINSLGLVAVQSAVHVGKPNLDPTIESNKLTVYNGNGGDEISNPFYVGPQGFYRNSTFTSERVFPWVDEDEYSIKWLTEEGGTIDYILSVPSDAIGQATQQAMTDAVFPSFDNALNDVYSGVNLMYIQSFAAGWEGTPSGPDQGFFAYATGGTGIPSTGDVDLFYDAAGVEYKKTNKMYNYDPTISGLAATNLKDAVDEVSATAGGLDTSISNLQSALGSTTDNMGAYTESFLTDDAPAKQNIQELSDAFKSITNWTQPTALGSTETIATTGIAKLAALSPNLIAIYIGSATQNDLMTYSYNGDVWSQVGATLAITGSEFGDIAAISSDTVAFIDDVGQELRSYQWNGSSWGQIGNSLPVTGSGIPALTALSSTEVAFIDITNDELRTYSWDGTDWMLNGSGLVILSVGIASITALSSSSIAFIDGTSQELRKYNWDGLVWSQDENGLNISPASAPTIIALNEIDISLVISGAGGDSAVQSYRWNGTDWAEVGISLELSTIGSVGSTSLNGTDIALFDNTTDTLRNYRYGFSLEVPYNQQILGA